MTTTLAPDYSIKAGSFWGYKVIRNDLHICTCKYRHDAEHIAYCLRIVEESDCLRIVEESEETNQKEPRPPRPEPSSPFGGWRRG